MAPVRVTGPLLDVLEVLLTALVDGDEDPHGWAIMKSIKRAGPTVYGVLDRLEDAAWIVGEWEAQPPDVSKPRRRRYRLTNTGADRARALLLERRPDFFRSSRARRSGVSSPAWLRIVPPAGGDA